MMKGRWVLDESKFLSTREARRLLRAVRSRAEKSTGPARKSAVREFLIVHLGLSTGLRVSEMASLRCGDVFVENGMSSLLVRRGKGGKPRTVRFSGELREHLVRYLRRKEEIGESVAGEAPLLVSEKTGGFMTTRAIQKAFKRCAARAGLSLHYSVHSLRHTYACHLYKASGWNLRLVQKQLGHASIATTQVYADVMEPDTQRALEKLYK
jgi:site-specific recombinase XerD